MTKNKKIILIMLTVVLALTLSFFSLGCILLRPSDSSKIFPPTTTPPLLPQRIFTYEEFGASGCGYVCDFDAIIATHTAANEYARDNNAFSRTIVRAFNGATYRIESGLDENNSHQTAIIQTDVDWTGATFIIDDTTVEYETRPLVVNNQARLGFYERRWNQAWVFNIAPSRPSYVLTRAQIAEIGSIYRYQEQISFSCRYGAGAVIDIRDPAILRYSRRGQNANPGTAQRDAFVIDANGNVDMEAPILWDFPNADSSTTMRIYPIDEHTLTATGGHFITINNLGNADDQFMSRGIHITRSNTIIDGLTRYVEGERPRMRNTNTSGGLGSAAVNYWLEGGASYTGFLFFENCANVVLQNSTLAGRRAYRRPSALGTVRGTYDIQANNTVNFSIINVDQIRDITNETWWGIHASNFSKNTLLDNVEFSRFDAHMGVHNVIIKNSKLGHQGVSVVGSGLLHIEGTEVHGWCFIWFRDDYGSKWNGDLYIIDSVYVVPNTNNGAIIHTNNDGNFNWLTELSMPTNITIYNFHIDDSNSTSQLAPLLFNVVAHHANATAQPSGQFGWTQNLSVTNLTIERSGAVTQNAGIRHHGGSGGTAFWNQLNIEWN